ncbi:Universal stress protein [hydrothermal vent metagenome]|uniref:Universal stress protein n=1 Tax=hydrothermal vent metagenome TaxID=652676 RepID=A0A3B0U454_9ZZZZ
MKRILIPTDFSNNSWNATRYALDLFKEETCTFFLLNTYTPAIANSRFMASTINGGQIDGVLDISENGLKNVVKRIEETCLYKNHSFKTISSFSLLVDEIKDTVERKQIDLIVMGTKGATGLKKVTMGSNTGDVITKVKCPLLAVPENAVYSKPKEIAFPMDFYLGYDVKVLDVLIELALLNKAALRILHVSKKGEELSEEQSKNKEFLEDYLMDVEHSFHFVSGTKLEVAVQCFVESRSIDMIAMVAKNLNYFQRILFRPSVEQISYHTEIPFLVLHER